jgi:hypothetical protein
MPRIFGITTLAQILLLKFKRLLDSASCDAEHALDPDYATKIGVIIKEDVFPNQ